MITTYFQKGKDMKKSAKNIQKSILLTTAMVAGEVEPIQISEKQKENDRSERTEVTLKKIDSVKISLDPVTPTVKQDSMIDFERYL